MKHWSLLGVSCVLLAAFMWVAPTWDLKSPGLACQQLHADAGRELPPWARFETAQGYDIDILRQQITCTWSRGPDRYEWTHPLHGNRSTWLLAGLAMGGLVILASAAVVNRTQRHRPAWTLQRR